MSLVLLLLVIKSSLISYSVLRHTFRVIGVLLQVDYSRSASRKRWVTAEEEEEDEEEEKN